MDIISSYLQYIWLNSLIRLSTYGVNQLVAFINEHKDALVQQQHQKHQQHQPSNSSNNSNIIDYDYYDAKKSSQFIY